MIGGRCPKCEQVMPHLLIETPKIKQHRSDIYLGITLSCPSCHTVLSAAIDPIAIKTDVIKSVVAGLRAPS